MNTSSNQEVLIEMKNNILITYSSYHRQIELLYNLGMLEDDENWKMIRENSEKLLWMSNIL